MRFFDFGEPKIREIDIFLGEGSKMTDFRGGYAGSIGISVQNFRVRRSKMSLFGGQKWQKMSLFSVPGKFWGVKFCLLFSLNFLEVRKIVKNGQKSSILGSKNRRRYLIAREKWSKKVDF